MILSDFGHKGIKNLGFMQIYGLINEYSALEKYLILYKMQKYKILNYNRLQNSIT